jgi:hypothetical protein
MTSWTRRRFLQGVLGGATVGVGVPWLEALQPRAWATAPTYPSRFGVWFWGNGNKVDTWTPASEGFGWQPSAALTSLADLTDHVSVLSGYTMPVQGVGHHAGTVGMMTGQRYLQLGETREAIVSTFAVPSIDQQVADALVTETPFRSLEVGVFPYTGSDQGTTYRCVSHAGPNRPTPLELRPYELYRRLFLGTADPTLDLARTSALDAVAGQLAELRTRVSLADRARLDQHTESVRSLERRLSGLSTASCSPPEVTSAYPTDMAHFDVVAIHQAFADILATAWACDLTRVATVQFSGTGSSVIHWQLGQVDPLHYLTHTETGTQPQVQAAISFTIAQFAAFLRTLRDTPEGDGTLLDHCSLLATSDVGDGATHGSTEYPLLLAGGGTGRLRPGQHLRHPGRSTSDAALTAALGAGVPWTSWGTEEGYSESVVRELLAAP